MKETIQNILLTAVGIAIAIGVVYLVMGIFDLMQSGMIRNEQLECYKWEKESHQYPRYDPETDTGYYVLVWQKMQCDDVGVDLTAKVKIIN